MWNSRVLGIACQAGNAARRGDFSPAQLENVETLQLRFGLSFRLIARTRKPCRSTSRVSMSRCPSMEPVSGATPADGFQRHAACSV